jgi:hypothetical protein
VGAEKAQVILALGFFTADLLNGTRVYVLAAIEHGTRRIRVLGTTENPVQSWVVQQARNLLMDLEDAGMSVKFVLHDGDASPRSLIVGSPQAPEPRSPAVPGYKSACGRLSPWRGTPA